MTCWGVLVLPFRLCPCIRFMGGGTGAGEWFWPAYRGGGGARFHGPRSRGGRGGSSFLMGRLRSAD
jgi:hypothetical protein